MPEINWICHRLSFLLLVSYRKKKLIECYLDTLLSITQRVDISHSNGILSQNRVNHLLLQCEEIMHRCSSIKKLCNLKTITSQLIFINKELE